jgi:hypothetical protein
MVRTTGIWVASTCCLVLLMSETSSAGFVGVLNGHADALPGWTGTAAFDNGNGLKGNLDYAVFTAADFLLNFAGQGYVPGDAYVYTYQLIASSDAGTDSISTEVVGIINPANTIGTFNIGDVNASSATFVGSNAQWLFNPEIPLGMSSWGLAFSSPNGPMNGVALTVDGGASVLITEIPTPAPEPGSLLLMICGGIFVCLLRPWR